MEKTYKLEFVVFNIEQKDANDLWAKFVQDIEKMGFDCSGAVTEFPEPYKIIPNAIDDNGNPYELDSIFLDDWVDGEEPPCWNDDNYDEDLYQHDYEP